MCPACPRAAGRNDGSSYTHRRLPRGHRPPMTSSPKPPTRCQYLLDLLAQIPDPRKKRGRRHSLAGLGAGRGPAEESMYRRAFAATDPDWLDRVLGAWLWTRVAQAVGRLVIAVDGKAVRGAK